MPVLPVLTPATALPCAGAVLRVMRGAAAGRRAVRVALLVGGLFVLGVLCGARANAAEGASASSPPSSTVTAAVAEATGPVAEQAVRPVTEQALLPVVQPVVEDVVQPVVEDVVRPVTEQVVVPVGEVVEAVTEGLGGVTAQLPPVSGLPSLPGVPGLPESPEPPGWTTLPVETPPVGATPLEPGRAAAERPGLAVAHDNGGRDGEPDSGTHVAAGYGPHAAAGGAEALSAPHRDAGAGGTSRMRMPAQRNSDSLPTGALGRHSAVDTGGPRHTEPYTVASFDRAPLSLVPGTPVADAPDGTRDRHRDIPESPG